MGAHHNAKNTECFAPLDERRQRERPESGLYVCVSRGGQISCQHPSLAGVRILENTFRTAVGTTGGEGLAPPRSCVLQRCNSSVAQRTRGTHHERVHGCQHANDAPWFKERSNKRDSANNPKITCQSRYMNIEAPTWNTKAATQPRASGTAPIYPLFFYSSILYVAGQRGAVCVYQTCT